MSVPALRLFTTGPSCSLCERTLADLRRLAERHAFGLEVHDLHDGPGPDPSYLLRTPVLHIDGRRVGEGRIGAADLEAWILRAQAAHERSPGNAS